LGYSDITKQSCASAASSYLEGTGLFDLLADSQKELQKLSFRSAPIEGLEKRLQNLSGRLAKSQLQLAVLGQFKRGKSTLLNALIGAPLLPSGVTPLTAIPTFLRHGQRFELITEYSDGRKERHPADTYAELSALLFERVTEDGNPHNKAGIVRVDVFLDSPLLRSGIVLIDTPGIGSTNLHNTEAAKAALPECDMALFVVSPDPPITEVELAYLRDIQEVSTATIIALNKIDLVDGEDRKRSEQFLSDTVLDGAGTKTAWFFSVSARKGLAAKTAGEEKGVAESGLHTLENYIQTFAQTKQRDVLEAAIAKKAAALIGEILFEIDTRVAMLKMPVADLTDRLARFTAARTDFEREQKASQDLLAGDRTRLLLDLDEKAAALRAQALDRLIKHASGLLVQGKSEGEIGEGLERYVPELFQAEFERVESEARASLSAALGEHQERGDRLIGRVRQLAASLLEIPYSAPVAEEAFQPTKTPYWVTIPREALISSPNIIETLLPATVRLDRARDRMRRRLDEIITRNVENLRWALRQNLEMAFRAFQSQLNESLALAEGATRSAMEAAIQKRSRTEGETELELTRMDDVRRRLAEIKAQTEEFV
jgi:ribosome biogenesis GTPase A